MINTLLTTAVDAKAMFPVALVVNAPVGMIVIDRRCWRSGTVSVKVGLASGAFNARSETKLVTPLSGSPVPLVKITDVGVPRIGVTNEVEAGRVTVPVKIGLASGALRARSETKLVTPLPVIASR